MSAAAAPVALRRAVTTSLAGKLAEIVTLALLALVVPRVLGAADYGRFALALTLVTVGTLALTLGGATTMARFVPEAEPGRRAAVARVLAARLARGRAAALALVALLTIAVAVAVPDVDAARAALVLIAIAAGVGATLTLQATLGLGRTGPWSARFAVQNALTVAAALAAHALHGATGAIAGVAVAAAITFAWSLAVALPALRDAGPRAEVPAGALRFGAWQAAAGALTQVAQRSGVVAVALVADARETAFAAVALGVALAGTYVVAQAFAVALPGLAEQARGDRAGAEADLRRMAIAALAVGAGVALGGAALAGDVVPALFGDEYRAGAGAFAIALGLLPLAPLQALAVQVSALRLAPQLAWRPAAAGLAAFALTAAPAAPAGGAEGGTLAAVAGAAAAAACARVVVGPLLGRGLTAAALACAAATVVVGAAA